MVDNNCRHFAYAMAQFMGVADKYKQVAKNYFFSGKVAEFEMDVWGAVEGML